MEMGKLKYRKPNKYQIIEPHKGGPLSLLCSLVTGQLGKEVKEEKGVQISTYALQRPEDDRFVITVSNLLLWLISVFSTPLVWIGIVVEFVLNFLYQNGGVIGIIWNILTFKLVIPQRGSDTFLSAIGYIDPRLELHTYGDDVPITGGDIKKAVVDRPNNRALMDLCMMSAKTAYENPKVVKRVVNNYWEMQFMEFYSGWNDYHKKYSTHVFIICDKHEDANLILIGFRGTGLFDPQGWSTDVDYSWYEVPGVGKVHIGFLEALGLGNRNRVSTFEENIPDDEGNTPETISLEPGIPGDRAHESSGKKDISWGINVDSAYYDVKRKLIDLLEQHKNAKFVVTGHSLGGALAVLFTGVLLKNKEYEVLKRLLGVYTFGQPRVGNEDVQEFMHDYVSGPNSRYFRVVYCNDIVSRVPFDDKVFVYKHFGTCIYYNSIFTEKNLGQEPNPNYFEWFYQPLVYINAIWELVRGLIMGIIYGKEYKETWTCILIRLFGLVIPGISAHIPKNYVDCPRLGQPRRRD